MKHEPARVHLHRSYFSPTLESFSLFSITDGEKALAGKQKGNSQTQRAQSSRQKATFKKGHL
jgi:hypothetical protein